jgi:uncharacterized membrane protein (UPF0127 family)
MKKIVSLVSIIAICAGVYVYTSSGTEMRRDIVTIDGTHTIQVEIANTETLRETGLGNRASLNTDNGMLFVFSNPGKQGFWMKDMFFPIDIMWMDSGKVVDIKTSISPDTYPQVFYPKSDAQYVLEVPSGYALKNQIKIGSNFSIGH